MANNPYVNKVQTADGTTLIDISDTTALAAEVLLGKYFYAATGEKLSGSASNGLEYETGTFTPESDVSKPFIEFANFHYLRPAFIVLADQTGTAATNNSALSFIFSDFSSFFGGGVVDTAGSKYALSWRSHQEILADGWTETSGETYGIIYTWSNGVCTLTGDTVTSNRYSYNALTGFKADLPDYIVSGESYAVTFNTTNTGANYKYRVVFMFYDSEGTQVGSTSYLPVGRTITVPAGAAKWYVYLHVSANTTISGTVTFSDLQMKNTTTGLSVNEILFKTLADGNTSEYISYWVLPNGFYPCETGRYLRANRTYKWVAVWAHRDTAYDMFDGLFTYADGTNNGVTFTWNGDVCTMGGSVGSGVIAINTIYALGAIPSRFVPGGTYPISFKVTTPGANDYHPYIRILWYPATGSYTSYSFLSDDSTTFTVPDDAKRWVIDVWVGAGKTITSGTTLGDICSLIPPSSIIAES